MSNFRNINFFLLPMTIFFSFLLACPYSGSHIMAMWTAALFVGGFLGADVSNHQTVSYAVFPTSLPQINMAVRKQIFAYQKYHRLPSYGK